MDMEPDAGDDQGDMAEEIKAVEIDAELKAIKSRPDHSYDVTINVPEYCLPQLKVMLGWLLYAVSITMVKED